MDVVEIVLSILCVLFSALFFITLISTLCHYVIILLPFMDLSSFKCHYSSLIGNFDGNIGVKEIYFIFFVSFVYTFFFFFFDISALFIIIIIIINHLLL
jgi:hypothetical protein